MTAPARPLTWDDTYRDHYLAVADRMVLVDTLEADALVVDLYQDPDDQPQRLQAVVSVRHGISLATAEPFIPEWAALAWETLPEPDPRARLVEALLQGHLRARERLTGDRGLVPLPRQ